jgi:hypothetical protein
MEYLVGAFAHLRRGRHEWADGLMKEAWRAFGGGLGMDAVAPDDLRRFAVMARVAGIGATPESALARVRAACGGKVGS